MILLAVGVVLLGVFVLRFRGDRRRFGNGVLLLLGILCAGGPLVASGVTVTGAAPVQIAIVLVIAYLGFLLVAFLLYALVYAWTTHTEDAAAIVVHGAGLRGDRVPPLLASRLDRALDRWRAESVRGPAPLLVVSGGKGSGERIAEADAMGSYLEERGVPAEAVLREDRSTTTRENLLFSKQLLAQRGIEHDIVLVTSNFHVLRTAILARAVGLDAQAIGAPTSRLYLPFALLREYVGVLAEHKWLHLTACVALAVAAFAG
ncbi:YdcF family protein [Nocardia sp. NPDC058176]|uniref:YdcF family protein n=1 Tax=Nocardia sp. NPDC058176 TaxID=3346368 RepID=UPI0036DBEF69